MISANDLRNKSFSVTDDGYNVDEVNFIIDEAAKTIDAYAQESQELYHKLEVLASKVEEYREEEDSIKSALIIAQKMADKIKRESNEEANALIADSKQKASETLAEANDQADKIVTSARDYSSKLIKEKSEEANNIVSNAQAKANEAISSAKIVAQDVLDQAKAISDDLITKSKDEKEAYDALVSSIKVDANAFVAKLIALYSEQLTALQGANFEVKHDEEAVETVDSIQQDVDSLVSEIDEMENAIPEEISIDSAIDAPEIEEEVQQEAPVYVPPVEIPEEEPVEEEPVQEAIEYIEPVEEINNDIEEIVIDDTEEDEAEEYIPANDIDEIEEIEEIAEEDDEPADPMEAVAAFSQNEFTPIDTSLPYIPEINEDAQMEDEGSLFDDDNASQLPFESYFNVKKEDAHSDRSQTISLIPPEDDDDEPKFKGFFKKKK